MKNILLFGAGKSATVLIDCLLDKSLPNDWMLTVADTDKTLLEEKTKHHKRAITEVLDISNEAKRKSLIEASDLVISMMPPALHILIAMDCIEKGKHLLTASYADENIRSLNEAAKEKNILILCEMGLDPGIDHMSAMKLLEDIKRKGGVIHSFKSHCGGLVAPESDDNPWHYKISWNPRNVVMAGKAGAKFKENGQEKETVYEHLFDTSQLVDTGIEEIGMLGYYPNRDSLSYIDLYGLHEADTFIRTTLRHPDFMYGWRNIVELNLTDENKNVASNGLTFHEFFKAHLEKNGFGEWLQQKLNESFTQTKSLLENLMKLMEAEEEAAETGEEIPENFMMVDETGDLKNIELEDIKTNAASTVALKMHEANLTLKQLFFLGMDDKETRVDIGTCSPADVLQLALETKLALKPDDKDMIIMLHEIDYSIEGQNKYVRSSLVVKGENSHHTAMAKTVGLPLAIAAELILNNQLQLSGVHIPVLPEIYEPILARLQELGIQFRDFKK
ncbi:MAG: saccharopine dehydrogenase C-terminal domain-containing protein [Ferruginibacter sp.]